MHLIKYTNLYKKNYEEKNIFILVKHFYVI